MSRDLDIRVCIIEDDETIREGYSFLIGNTAGYKVISSYPSFEEAAKKIATDDPDVILLDVELPGISGIDAIPKLKKLLPETYILILTVYEQDILIFRALGNGASGYLTKNTPPEKIISAIHEVMEGGGPMSAHIARMVIDSFKRNESSPLTRRCCVARSSSSTRSPIRCSTTSRHCSRGRTASGFASSWRRLGWRCG